MLNFNVEDPENYQLKITNNDAVVTSVTMGGYINLPKSVVLSFQWPTVYSLNITIKRSDGTIYIKDTLLGSTLLKYLMYRV